MKTTISFWGLTAALLASASLAAAANPPDFYTFCMEMGVPGVKPRPVPEQAATLREAGFDGAGYVNWLDEHLEGNLQALDAAGLKLFLLQAGINVDPKAAEPYDKRLPDVIRRLKGRPVTVAVSTSGLKRGDPAGEEVAIRSLRELGDVAASVGLRISLYNHVNTWAESVPNNIELVRKVDHPKVGYNFNLCHWVKVEGDKDPRPLLRKNADKLFVVTICGSQIGAPAWTNGLIQPLDKGDFDNRALLATLAEIGYRGPVGLMCYGVPGDLGEHLARSMRVWKSWFTK